MKFVSRIPTGVGTLLCPEGFAGPRGTRALLDERRTVIEARTLVRDPIWTDPGTPHGEHRPVMLLPGFMSGDYSMSLLSRWLRRAGYAPLRSQVRLNVECSRTTLDRLTRRVEIAALHEGRPVTVIGHSLGGIFAKTIAMRRPDLVAGVVALGSPLLAPTASHKLLLADVALLNALNRAGLRRLMNADCVHGECAADSRAELAGPFPSGLPFLSVYSRSDGIIDYKAAQDPAAEHVEVDGSHCGMTVNPGVYHALAEHLPRLTGLRAARPGAAA
jgi:pimeloyl-ACP methyl ester carboxylesterase